MGDIHDYTPDEEEQILKEIGAISNSYVTNRGAVSIPMGLALDDLLQVAPDLDPQLLADVASATAAGMWDIDDAANFVIEAQNAFVQQALMEEQKKKQEEQGSNWFERMVGNNAYGAVKATSRFGMAALQFLPDVVSNVSARAVGALYDARTGSDPRASMPNYVRPETGLFDGWFASTELGQWFSGEEMGSGFFLSQDAKRQQEEQAIRYRGGFLEQVIQPEMTRWDPDKKTFVLQQNVNTGTRVVGWTPGRGLAYGLGADPGSESWHTISGALDAGYQLLIPSLPGGKAVGKVAGTAAESVGVGDRVLYRGMNGLRNLGTPYINRGRVNSWLGSRAGRTFREQVQSIDNYSDARRLLPNANVQTLNRVVNEAVTPEATMRVLQEEMGIVPGLRSTQDVQWSRWSSVKAKVLRNPVSQTVSLERAAARRAGNVLTVGFANDIEKTRTVKDIEDWLIAGKVAFDDSVDAAGNVVVGRKTLMNRVMKAMTDDPADMYRTLQEVRDALGAALVSRGLPGGMIERLFDTFTENLDDINRFGDITANGAADLHSVVGKTLLAQTDDGRWANVVVGDDFKSAFLDSEHLRHQIYLPPIDEIIRATSPYKWLFEAGSISRSVRRRIKKMKGLSPDEIVSLEKNFLTFAGGGRIGGHMAGGQLRSGLAILDFLQNSVFKKLVLASQAYIFRAVVESTTRQAFAPGLRGGLMHPIETITAAIMSPRIGRYLGTLEGDVWKAAEVRYLDEAFKEYIEGSQAVIAGELMSSQRALMAHQAHAWRSYVPGDPEFRRAFEDNIHLLANDRLTRVYAEFGTDEVVRRAGRTADGRYVDEDVVKALKDIEFRLANKKYDEIDPSTGQIIPPGSSQPAVYKPKFFDDNGDPIDWMIRQHIDSYVAERFTKFTRGNPHLEEIIRNGSDGGRFLDPVSGREVYAFVPYEVSSKMPAGAIGSYGEEFRRIVNGLPDDHFPPVMKGRVTVDVRMRTPNAADPRTAKVVEMGDKAVAFFFQQLAARPEAWLNRSPVFRKYYHYSINALLDDLAPGEAAKIIENMGLAYRTAAIREVSTLERATQLSNGSWKVGNKVYSATRYERKLTAARNKLAKMDKWQPTAARPYAFPPGWGARYVGSKELFNDIVDRATGKVASTGGRSLEEISTFSKAFALAETKRLLYDVSEASNFAEAFTIISPFVKAWKEGVSAWPRRLLTNPEKTRRLGITYQGLEEADPDHDGRGFIYKDPISGRPVFSLPLGNKDYLLPFATTGGFVGAGISAGLGLPVGAGYALGAVGAGVAASAGVPGISDVKEIGMDISYDVPSLNMGLQSVGPGLGPVVQMGVAELAQFIPGTKELEQMLMPYGPPEGGPFAVAIPSFIKKMAEAASVIMGQDGGKFFYQYVTEAHIALMGTNNYDTANEESMRQLEKDARAVGLSLLLVHTAAQFTGPARPDVEIIIPTKFEGVLTQEDAETYFSYNVPLRYLAAEWRRMQDEDYANASMNFIKTFGAYAYEVMAGGSQSNVKGLSATEKFGEWMDNNRDIIRDVPDMYGYFAGAVGNDFDGWTYNQLIMRGDKVRFDDPKQQQVSAQTVLARALYIDAVRAAGPDPDIAQEIMLKTLKQELERRYPLWASAPRALNERQQTINSLQNYVFELESLQDNTVAQVARQYFSLRDQAIQIANQRRANSNVIPAGNAPLSGKANQDLRGRLRLAGFLLANAYPDFERVWLDVLFDEVDVTDYDE